MLSGKILCSKVVMTENGPPLPTHCSKNCCLCRRGIVSGLTSWLLSVIFSAPHTLFQQNIDNDKEFFQRFYRLWFDVVSEKISLLPKVLVEKHCIPPHRLPVLVSFLGCITVILKPDNPTFERMQKKELIALYPFLSFTAETLQQILLQTCS